jgi:hypothetical protein
MNSRHPDTRAQLTTFLGLTFALSAIFYWLIIDARSLGEGGGRYLTVDTGPTNWLTTEFGAGLAITTSVTAWLFWRARDALASHGEPRTVRSETPQLETAAVGR